MSNEHDIEDDPLQAATLSESFADIPLHAAADPANDARIPPAPVSAPVVDSGGDVTESSTSEASVPALESLALSEEALEEERAKQIDWKEDYEKKLAEWRETAAVARAEVSLRHDKWEKIRETETEDDMLRELSETALLGSSSSSSHHPLPETTTTTTSSHVRHESEEDKNDGWESLGASTMASSFVDARDLVSGETPAGSGAAALDAMFPPLPSAAASSTSNTDDKDPAHHPTTTTTTATTTTTTHTGPAPPTDSTNLIDIDTDADILSNPPSQISSFPSLDFDDSSSDKHGPSSSKRRRATITLSNRNGGQAKGGDTKKGDKSSVSASGQLSSQAHSDPQQPLSVTLAVFDSSLPTRTRVLAVVSAVAINFCLPFINGVMLGFGEIFAKNIVSWVQIKRGKAAPAVAGVGLSTGKRK